MSRYLFTRLLAAVPTLLVLPTLALALGPAAALMRLTRARMLEVLSQDHVRTARAKGLPGGTVARWHVLRNAAVPIASVLGLRFGHILAAAGTAAV